MKTQELTGAALDWAVAKCEGMDLFETEGWVYTDGTRAVFRPSTDWAQGGPIIERERLTLDYFPDGGHPYGGEWLAQVWDDNGNPTKEGMGETILIATMRCYCCAKLGDKIEVPDELH